MTTRTCSCVTLLFLTSIACVCKFEGLHCQQWMTAEGDACSETQIRHKWHSQTSSFISATAVATHTAKLLAITSDFLITIIFGAATHLTIQQNCSGRSGLRVDMAKLRHTISFLLSFQLLTNVMGWTYSFANSGTIQTPNSLRPRTNDTNTTWLLTAQPQKMLKLEFLDFKLDDRRAVLYVYEGAQLNKPYARYTGTRRPSTLHLESNQSVLRLATDDSKAEWRFKLKFSSYVPSTLSGYKKTFNLRSSGKVFTPNYPGPYPHNSNVTWFLKADARKGVQLQIIDFRLPENDTLFVYEGKRSSRKLHSRFTGTVKKSTISLRSGEAILVFTSDGSRAAKGFDIKFKSYPLPQNGAKGIRGARTNPSVKRQPVTEGTVNKERSSPKKRRRPHPSEQA